MKPPRGRDVFSMRVLMLKLVTPPLIYKNKNLNNNFNRIRIHKNIHLYSRLDIDFCLNFLLDKMVVQYFFSLFISIRVICER